MTLLPFVQAVLAGTLSGTLSDETGAPLVGATVVAYDARFAYATATTTSDGGWSIVGLPAGAYRVRFLPPDDSPAVDRFHADRWDVCDADVVAVPEEGEVSGIDAALPIGGRLSGQLVGPDGAAVPGVSMVATGEDERAALVSRATATDEDGRFTFEGLDSEPGAPSPYAVQAQKTGWPRQYLGPGYASDEAAIFDVARGEAVDAGTLSLLAGIAVEGTAVGPDGPLPSGTAIVYSSSQAKDTDIQADGSWRVDGLPPGSVVAWASSEGYATTYYPDADRPGESVPAEDEGMTLSGVELRLPEESTLTISFTGSGDVAAVSVLLYNSTRTVGRGDGADETGTVTLRGLHPGEYTLYVYGEGGGFVDGFVAGDDGEPRALSVDGDTALTVALTPGASLRGRLVDDAGEAVYGGHVYAFPFQGDDTWAATADAEGDWEIAGLPAGTYALRASYVHYCDNDQGYVTAWWDGSWTETGADVVDLLGGEALDDVDFVLPRDPDHDQMGNAWEAEHGLDTARDDAAEDPDGDGFTNLEEWQLGTDPTSATSVFGGCGGCAGDGSAAVGLLLPLAYRRRRRAACTGTPRASNLR